jgi:stage V sporulation protein D (sporulation-specific penicillin-binding protein)
MLVDVVENGHGKQAGVKGYYIAGKTGTAQVASSNNTGYDPNHTIGSFVGFGPVDNPQFLMLVRIDNPRDVKFAESTAAPAFGAIAQFILNYLKVPPSRQ